MAVADRGVGGPGAHLNPSSQPTSRLVRPPLPPTGEVGAEGVLGETFLNKFLFNLLCDPQSKNDPEIHSISVYLKNVCLLGACLSGTSLIIHFSVSINLRPTAWHLELSGDYFLPLCFSLSFFYFWGEGAGQAADTNLRVCSGLRVLVIEDPGLGCPIWQPPATRDQGALGMWLVPTGTCRRWTRFQRVSAKKANVKYLIHPCLC